MSIIIASFNEAKSLPNLLTSIRAQTHKDIEVIVVEGSTNVEIREIADHYGAKLVHDEWNNIGYSRNLGTTVASGDLFFFTNADCTMDDPRLLEKVTRKFQENPKLVCCGGITKEICDSEMTQIIYNTQHVLRRLFSLLPYPAKRYRPTANFIVTKATDFKRMGGFPEVYVNEDGVFGEKLEKYAWKSGLQLEYALELRVAHPTRRFDKLGPLGGLRHYLYVLPNFMYVPPRLVPLLGRALNAIGQHGERSFRVRESEIPCKP